MGFFLARRSIATVDRKTQIVWPDAARRAELAGVIGEFCEEWSALQMSGNMKSTNRRIKKERKTWSGKKKVNSWKKFSIMDYTGRYIYVYVGLAKNDREMFTSLPLYLQRGYWFSDGEFIAADGGFEGDGPVRASFKNPGADTNK